MSSLASSFQIVFQNDDFLVINKENNLSTQKNDIYDTSVEGLLEAQGNPFSTLARCGIVHRLDRDTTGILIIAKNETSLLLFEKIFKERKIEKTYLSFHKGSPESSSGEIKFYQRKKFTKGKSVRMETDPLIGKLVNLNFRLVKKANSFSLIEVSALTGRTHQIRLAFQKIGFPIYNDPLYNGEKIIDKTGQYLHAWKLSFSFKKTLFAFEAELPTFFQKKLDEVGIDIS